MIGLDTNVLVRYIMQDDAKQSPQATRLIESLDAENPGYITTVSIVELYWVLTASYELTAAQAAQEAAAATAAANGAAAIAHAKSLGFTDAMISAMYPALVQ